MGTPFFCLTRKLFGCLAEQAIGSGINLAAFSGIVTVFAGDALLMLPAVGAVTGRAFSFLMSTVVVFSERSMV
jgi:hypothetical protein